MSHRLQHLQKRRVEQTQHYQQQQEEPQRPTNMSNQSPNQAANSSPASIRPIFPPANTVQAFERADLQKGKRAFPPPDTLFTTKQGELDPAFLRSSLSVLHTQPRKTSLPIGLWISPFAKDQVRVVDVRSPLRCARCKAYVNPYFQFDGARRAVTCNLCGLRFNIEENIDRANIDSSEVSSELVIDFQVVDKFYMKKRTDIIKIFVAVELSMHAIELGIVATVISSLKSMFESHEFEDKIKIGVVFFSDSGVGFLRKADEGNDPTIFLVPNNKNGNFCCPLSDDEHLFAPNAERQKLGLTLDFLQTYADNLWKQGKFTHQASYISAVKSIKECFEQEAGRIVLFSLLDPKTGPCAIRVRNEEQSKLPLKPLHLETYELARDLVRARIGVDHFYFSKDNMLPHELPTTHFLSSLTGGDLHLYNSYNDTQSQHLYYNIFHTFTRPAFYDADFTCRSSTGTSVLRYGIPEGLRESRDVGLSMLGQSSSFTVELDQEEKLEEHLGAFVQFALMYTTGSGERRIRIINYKFEVSSRLDLVYDSVDYLTFANIVAKTYTYKLLKFDPAKPREDAIVWLRGITEQYRTKCQNLRFVRINDISLPEKLAWAFSYLHVILNSKLFLSHIKTTPDLRMLEYLKLHSCNPYFFATRYYPRVYPLTLDIYAEEPLPGDFIEDGQEQEEEEDESQKIAVLPTNLALNKQSFKEDGAYLYDAADHIVIFVQPQANEQLLNELFATTRFEEIEQTGLPELETSHNIRVNNIIAQIRRRSSLHGGMYQPLVIKTPLKKGPYGEAFHNIQKEDYFDCKYPEFLDIIRRPINVPK